MNNVEILEIINKNNQERNAHIEKALHNIMYAIGASCSCLTKTPHIEYHKDDCTYKKLRQAEELLSACIVK